MKNWTDVYKLPLKLDEYGTNYVYDSKNQFVFQFEIEDKRVIKDILDKLNGKNLPILSMVNFTHDKGEIRIYGHLLIIIRGWGNLTGTGALNLSEEDAANIQDTFAEWIVETLNR
jgi:uncharacterized protein with ACT and thioredoxin-like domain